MSGENQLQSIYADLCTCSVFCGLWEQPLFHRFREYMEAKPQSMQKLLAYAAWVNVIYGGGGNLAACVRRAVFEDENVYIRMVAAKQVPNSDAEQSVARELAVLSAFASLTSQDFAAEMPVSVSAFRSETINLYEEYRERLSKIEKYGYGIFAFNGMFRLSDREAYKIEPIGSSDPVTLDSFIGYREEREKVILNTQAFVDGKTATNVLLYGDAGTGKSSTVKAVANRFFSDGIRLIELRKDQMAMLPFVMEKINGNPLKFIIFIDDLSFNGNDDTFSMLKAVLEGSASAKAPNAVIYATSNRRHIVRETFEDRAGSDIHRNDTVQEQLSLSARFGLTVRFEKPNKALYLEMIRELAKKKGIVSDLSDLEMQAEAFALSRGCRSARCAEQFVDSLL